MFQDPHIASHDLTERVEVLEKLVLELAERCERQFARIEELSVRTPRRMSVADQLDPSGPHSSVAQRLASPGDPYPLG